MKPEFVTVTKRTTVKLRGEGELLIQRGRNFRFTEVMLWTDDGNRHYRILTASPIGNQLFHLCIFDSSNNNSYPTQTGEIWMNFGTNRYQSRAPGLFKRGTLELTYQFEEQVNNKLTEISPGVYRVGSLEALVQLASRKGWRSTGTSRGWDAYCDRENRMDGTQYPLLVVDHSAYAMNQRSSATNYSITAAPAVKFPNWRDDKQWVEGV